LADLNRPSHLLSRLWASVRVQACGLVLAMAVFLGAGLLATQHVTGSIDELIHRTTAARLRVAAAQAVLTALQDSESGERGYLLTGQPSYLEPYNATIGRIESLLGELEQRVQDDPALRSAYERLATAARQEVLEMRRTVTLAQRDGPGAAGTVVLGEAGDQAMRQARQAAHEIIVQAEAERSRNAASLQLTQTGVTDTLLAALFAAVLLLGAAALLLLWSKARLRRARTGEQREAAQLQAAVEHVPGGVGVFDASGGLTLANSRFAPMLALPPGLVVTGAQLAPIALAAGLQPPLPSSRPAEASTTEARQATRTLEVWRSPMPDGGQMLSVADVTRRVQAEEVARQAQKMDVLGQMTGGVAHDFNNLLQIVSANLELVRVQLAKGQVEPGPLLERVDAAGAGVVRGARLIRHLLAFARRQPLAPEPLDPKRLLLGMEDMLRRTLGGAVWLELSLARVSWSMRADPTQFENALLNLALNARDAMAGADGVASGRFAVDVADITLDQGATAAMPDVLPGQYVLFAVTDTGAGMTPEQIARATEPFYTTKPEGRGTGLGLSMVLGFAKQSGGHLQLHSEPGRGTTARLYIPRTHLPARDAERSPLDVPRSHAATVLLVEDDAAVRLVARDALRSLGYAVEEAADADAALALLRAGLRPEVLFTDVVMPGTMNGKALADEARRLQPGVAVLLTSGYSQDKTTSAGRTGAAPPLLSKPWQTAQLARALNDALLLARHGGEPDAPAGPPRVLLVEDEEMVRLTTADALGELGFDVVQADTAQGALARLDPPPDLLLTDLGLPDQDGTWLVSEVRRHLPGLPVIIASGQADPQEADVVWLAKPYDMPGLTAALGAALPAQPNLRRPGLLRPEPVQAGTP